jgi:hypothetical protein
MELVSYVNCRRFHPGALRISLLATLVTRTEAEPPLRCVQVYLAWSVKLTILFWD